MSHPARSTHDRPGPTQTATTASMNPTEPWMLSEKGGLNAGEEVIHGILAARRCALMNLVRSIPATAWHTPSRCSQWTVHQVVRHVRDVARIQVARLQGDGNPFGRNLFDPRTSPAQWLARSEGETPGNTVDQLASLLQCEDALFSQQAGRQQLLLVPGQLRREVHWSVAVTHSLWDAWMHERDIAVPLGLTQTPGDAEMRLMIMYSLLAAAGPAARENDHIDLALGLTGSPDHTYRIGHAGDDLYVSVATGAQPQLSGPMDTVLDSLAGRGPELANVLGASGKAVRRLALLRAQAT